jgi:hypothetical protein
MFSNLGNFKPRGKSFHALVIFGLGKHLLFKSVKKLYFFLKLQLCDSQMGMLCIELIEIAQRRTYLNTMTIVGTRTFSLEKMKAIS